MDASTMLWNWSPVLQLALLGLLLALGPLAWVWMRHRGAGPVQALRALTLVTLFFTFDLVLFGAFTRLTDSGLGCPDWPGCYGSASPVGAAAQIDAAQQALPTGPVTTQKAWIEMIHRYLATAVGVLILGMTALSWRVRIGGGGLNGTGSQENTLKNGQAAQTAPLRSPSPSPSPWGGPSPRQSAAELSPWWPTLTLAWVIMQGAFGALTVTMKLYPAIVTLHLLGGLGLLALLAAQAERFRQLQGGPMLDSMQSAGPAPRPIHVLRQWLAAVGVLCLMQIALGGWVSTNYAVLACTDFPTCQGSWWPEMQFAQGFSFIRELGMTAEGEVLQFPALTAIHYTHRLMAYVVLAALLMLSWNLRGHPMWSRVFAGIALWQLITGFSNVVLGWPLIAAVSHTGGAAALVLALTTLWVRSGIAEPVPVSHPSTPFVESTA